MRNLIASTAFLAGLALIPPMHAQPPYGYEDGHYRAGRPAAFVDQVLMDLNRVQTDQRLGDHARDNVNAARSKLRKFQDRWAQGKFDDDKLKDAINHVEQLANSRDVRGADHAMLMDDLRGLRDFRATRGRSVSGNYHDYDYSNR